MPEWITLTLASPATKPRWVQTKWIVYFADREDGSGAFVQFSDEDHFLGVKETADEIAMLLGIKREKE